MNSQDLVIATLITTVIGLIVPPIVSFLRGVNTPVQYIGAINFFICLLGAFVALWVQKVVLVHPPTDARGNVVYWLGDFVLVFNQAKVLYDQVYKTIGIKLTDTLERVGPRPGDSTPHRRHTTPH